MKIDPEISCKTYQIFVVEVSELLQIIETELVNLSDNLTPIKVNRLMRAAHSIKGGAANVGLKSISTLAHQIEDIFRVLNHPELKFDKQLERLLLQLYDCLERQIISHIEGKKVSDEVKTNAEIALAMVDDKIGHFVIAGQALPDAMMFGADITDAIFAVDVARSLERLEQVLLDPSRHRILAGEFRAQAEVFTGIADMLALPGIEKIARATIAALDLHLDRVTEIACFALVCFQQAMYDVLRGDRQSGGELSLGLATLATPEVKIEDSDEAIANPSLALLPSLDEIFEPELGSTFREATNDIQEPLPLDRVALIPDRQIDFFLDDLMVTESRSEIELGHRFPVCATSAIDTYDLADIFEPTPHTQLPTPNSQLPTPASDFLLAELVTTEQWKIPLSYSPSLDSYDLADIFEAIISTPHTPVRVATRATPTTPQPSKRKKTKARKILPTAPQLSVRVGVDRLERMSNVIGELVIERNGLALSSEQLDRSVGKLRSQLEQFQEIASQLRTLADNLLVDASPVPEPATESELTENFDAIEFDRYGKLHKIVQATVEQIAQIEENIEDISLFSHQSERTIERQKQFLSYLGDDLRWARMLPLSEILNRFPRTLHDLSTKFQKPVDLEISGAGVLVDKAAIEKLLDPLVHLLRNAFDHGIEPPALRQAAGKPPRGLITITAYYQGSQTVIEIQDDGRGIDADKIAAKALKMGILTPEALSQATKDQLFELIFTPGFSTAQEVTELSGRGMGLDIVKEQIQAIKGSISISSKLGRGTTFILRIPLTLTVAQLMVCQVGHAFYAIPADSIQKIIVPTRSQIQEIDSQPMLCWQQEQLPIHNLGDLVTYSIPVPERNIAHSLKDTVINPPDWLPPILLIRTRKRLVALQIDRLITEQELTIKSLGKAIAPPKYIFGCTILGDGTILPVLDVYTLIRTLIDRPPCAIVTNPPNLPLSLPRLPSILVVDDSITARQSLCLSLEQSGYVTFQAKDGQEALQILRQKSQEIKLTICDVEMPNMNGFEFLNARRQDPAIAHIPVVMLTSRSNDKHRQFAKHLGAKGYFIKPYVESNLLTAIEAIVIKKST
jgi:chemotaxis family two-component system sensor histidine kinase/response regulator PixL